MDGDSLIVDRIYVDMLKLVVVFFVSGYIVGCKDSKKPSSIYNNRRKGGKKLTTWVKF